MSKGPMLDGKASPICPRCSKPLFRAGRMATMMERIDDQPGDAHFTVCMHCSTIWQITGEVANLQFTPATDAQIKLWPFLERAAKCFQENRQVAEILGLSVDDFADILSLTRSRR